MIRVTFDFRTWMWTAYGKMVVVPTLMDAPAAMGEITGPGAIVEIVETRVLTDAEYQQWLDYQRRQEEWAQRAKAATAYRGLVVGWKLPSDRRLPVAGEAPAG